MAKKKEETAIEVKQQAALSTEVQETWGTENVENSDIIVPRLLAMQGLSKLVTDGVARFGEIRDSLEGKLLRGMQGKEIKPVRIVIFDMFKSYIEFEDAGKGPKFKRILPSGTGQEPAMEEIIDGKKITRDRTLNFYCLLASELEEGTATPYLLSCRRTSYKCGKKLSTSLAKLRAFKRPAAAVYFDLTVNVQENDKGKFSVFDVSQLEGTTKPEHLAEAKKWWSALKTAKVQVDMRDMEAETSQPPADNGEY